MKEHSLVIRMGTFQGIKWNAERMKHNDWSLKLHRRVIIKLTVDRVKRKKNLIERKETDEMKVGSVSNSETTGH